MLRENVFHVFCHCIICFVIIHFVKPFVSLVFFFYLGFLHLLPTFYPSQNPKDLVDSGEESEKENEKEKEEARAKRELYKKQLKKVSRINPRVKASKTREKKLAKPPQRLSAAQKEDIKKIKLDEVSAKWICPYQGKKPKDGEDDEAETVKGGGDGGLANEDVKTDAEGIFAL